MVDDAAREDPAAETDDDGLRRTIDPATERRIDGAGSKPFSNMAAMASALIESEPLTELDRRIVALRRRTVGRVDEDALDARFLDATGDEEIGPPSVEPATDESVPETHGEFGRPAPENPVGFVGDEGTPARSEDGERTRGATGRSTRATLRRIARDGETSERRSEPRAPTALARRRSNDDGPAERSTRFDVDDGEADDDRRSDVDGEDVEIDRRRSFPAVVDGGTVRVEPPSLERDDPVDADVGFDVAVDLSADGVTDGVRDDAERVSTEDVDRETIVGEGWPVTVMASAAWAASVDARGLVRSSERDESRGVLAGRTPPSVGLLVRASRRRRKDSAAAAPAPVNTADRDDVGFTGREVDADRLPIVDVDVGTDANRDGPPVAVDVRLWIVPSRSDDEDASVPICRSATVRATNPTNGERAEPPGKVVTRSTVAV